MKLDIRPLPLTTCVGSETRTRPLAEPASVVAVSSACPLAPPVMVPAASGLSSSVHIVGILAFGQSLLFLLLWLFFCAWAGAATSPAPASDLELTLSSYHPAQTRDPFQLGPTRSIEAKIAAETGPEFVLQGILYDTTSPAAIVNDHLVTLNKSVNLPGKSGVVAVKAIEITRDRVILEASGKKTELRLTAAGADRQKTSSGATP